MNNIEFKKYKYIIDIYNLDTNTGPVTQEIQLISGLLERYNDLAGNTLYESLKNYSYKYNEIFKSSLISSVCTNINITQSLISDYFSMCRQITGFNDDYICIPKVIESLIVIIIEKIKNIRKHLQEINNPPTLLRHSMRTCVNESIRDTKFFNILANVVPITIVQSVAINIVRNYDYHVLCAMRSYENISDLMLKDNETIMGNKSIKLINETLSNYQ